MTRINNTARRLLRSRIIQEIEGKITESVELNADDKYVYFYVTGLEKISAIDAAAIDTAILEIFKASNV